MNLWGARFWVFIKQSVATTSYCDQLELLCVATLFHAHLKVASCSRTSSAWFLGCPRCWCWLLPLYAFSVFSGFFLLICCSCHHPLPFFLFFSLLLWFFFKTCALRLLLLRQLICWWRAMLQPSCFHPPRFQSQASGHAALAGWAHSSVIHHGQLSLRAICKWIWESLEISQTPGQHTIHGGFTCKFRPWRTAVVTWISCQPLELSYACSLQVRFESWHLG